MNKVIAIAYDTDEEYDMIRKYYTNYKHFEHLKIVLFNSDNDDAENEAKKLLPQSNSKSKIVSNRADYTYRLVDGQPSTTRYKYHPSQYQQQYQYNIGVGTDFNISKVTYTPDQLLYYRTVHQLLRFDFAIDEITKQAQSPVPPCGDSNIIIVLDTGINDRHEAFSSDYLVHLSDTHTLKAEGLVIKRSAIGDNGDDDYMVHGHGTAVSYLVRVFAPNADIISMKVMRKVVTSTGRTEWQATDEDILEGLNTAIHIIDVERERKHSFGTPYITELYNMSFGGEPSPTPTPVELAIAHVSKQRPQSLFIGAAGNTGPMPSTIVTPAQSPWCVAVGACDSSFIVTSFSARGPSRGLTKPEYLLPGLGLIAASRAGVSEYAQFTGTSFATPLLTGGIATLLSGAFFITPQMQRFIQTLAELKLDIQGIMNYVGTKITVKPMVPDANLHGKDNVYGWGIPQGDRIAATIGFIIQQMQQPPSAPSLLLSTLVTTLTNTVVTGTTTAVFAGSLRELVELLLASSS